MPRDVLTQDRRGPGGWGTFSIPAGTWKSQPFPGEGDVFRRLEEKPDASPTELCPNGSCDFSVARLSGRFN